VYSSQGYSRLHHRAITKVKLRLFNYNTSAIALRGFIGYNVNYAALAGLSGERVCLLHAKPGGLPAERALV
jgi:hypothetical protein